MTGDNLDLSALLGDQGPRGDARVDRVLQAVPTPPKPLRMLLGLVVLVQAPIVLTWLFNADPFGVLGDAVDEVHLVRDGAFGLVILTAAAMTVWRPRWAVPSFAIASVALLAQLVAGFADESISASGWNEAFHLVLLVTTLLIGSCGLWLKPIGRPDVGRLAEPDQHNVTRLDEHFDRR